MSNKLERSDLELIYNRIEELLYILENNIKKESESGFKIMLTKLKNELHEQVVVLNKGFEAYDYLEMKRGKNEK